MTPYERSAESRQEREASTNSLIKKGAKTAVGAVSAGVGLGASAALSKRLLPLLSEYIPTSTAIKGIGAISPKLGNFLQKGMEQGMDVKEGLEFIKDKVTQKAPDQKSIIEQYSPELHQFLTGEIQKGRQPLEAGALAETSGKFKKQIAQMVKDHKTPFSSILEATYGSAQQPQQQSPQQDQQTQQGPANGDEALMAALQKILSM